jgi:hypothetical protein
MRMRHDPPIAPGAPASESQDISQEYSNLTPQLVDPGSAINYP